MRIICLSGWLAVAINPDKWSSTTVYACLHHICLRLSCKGDGLSMCNLFLLQTVSLKINSSLVCSDNKGRISHKVTIFSLACSLIVTAAKEQIKMTRHYWVMLCVSHIYQSCCVCPAYIFTVYCCMSSTVATSSAGKSITRSKKVSVLESIIRKTELNLKIKGGQNYPGTCLISETVPENPGRMCTLL
jgi:hypothetical protein